MNKELKEKASDCLVIGSVVIIIICIMLLVLAVPLACLKYVFFG